MKHIKKMTMAKPVRAAEDNPLTEFLNGIVCELKPSKDKCATS